MNVPANLLYTKDHEWARVEGKMATVGITDYAQHELGDIVYVELPAVDKDVKKGEVFSVLESVKATSDCYSPVTGKVAAVNEVLAAKPELLNSSPYDGGWIAKFDLANEAEISELMDAKSYEQHIGKISK